MTKSMHRYVYQLRTWAPKQVDRQVHKQVQEQVRELVQRHVQDRVQQETLDPWFVIWRRHYIP